MSTEVKVAQLPMCDICKKAHMCESDFQSFGVGLGTGRGQRLVVED